MPGEYLELVKEEISDIYCILLLYVLFQFIGWRTNITMLLVDVKLFPQKPFNNMTIIN